MPFIVTALLLLLMTPGPAAGSERFDAWFQDRTLRFDYFHTGTRTGESISLDAFRIEPGGWAGTRAHLIDTSAWGKYRLVVRDAATEETIFTRAFSTLFGEWQTTGEAGQISRTFHESVQMPLPRRRALIVLESRRADNAFVEIFRTECDPASHRIAQTGPPEGVRVLDIEVHGPPSEKVDLVFLGDGYAAREGEKFRRDVRRFTERLFRFEPFASHRSRFNVRAVEHFTRVSGVTEPRKGIWRDTPAGSSFNTFDTERYLTTLENRKVRDLASAAPHDRILVMVNSSRYGGGGIHDFFAVFTSDNEYSGYVMVHEFGHAFAGLGDEYYTSEVAYNEFYPAGVEPWEPNITALVPEGRPKWAARIPPEVPVPTPAREEFAGVVGAFEGAGYAAKGLFRPALDCQMFSKGDAPFDPVCSAAIRSVIDRIAPTP